MAKKRGSKGKREAKDTGSGQAVRDPEEEGSSSSGSNGKRRQENTLLEWSKSLAVALVLFLVIRTFLVHTFVIISGSMEDTLLVGDLLLVNRAAVGSRIPGTSIRIPGYSKVERRNILVFDPPHEENMKLVKRLMGLPGDTIEMRNRVFMVNGVALDEPYVKHQDIPDESSSWMAWQADYVLRDSLQGSYRPTRDNWGPLVIPPDRYFMLGDNRETSLDSRYWGFLEGWRLEGRAILIYFSYNKDSLRPFPWLREIRWSRIGKVVH